jgi:hypothetical protein
MKLKRRLLAILLMLTPVLMSFAGEQQGSPQEQGNAWGIESGELYPGLAVLEILAAAESEIDRAVKEAYEEGYKAAASRYAPEAEYWKSLAGAAMKDSGGLAGRFGFGTAGFVLGVVGMGLYSFAQRR